MPMVNLLVILALFTAGSLAMVIGRRKGIFWLTVAGFLLSVVVCLAVVTVWIMMFCLYVLSHADPMM
ncbi:MAG: hypothetical protein A3E64_00110 [Candidatus Harrisonbacteria bacterium RIFCSPHIGHO2_12_FULL_48_16]|uniref:Uncharacterized protein n=2 Tax=Parcubacteria group TaxID=1794811 RepID=A0A1F5CC83_9BACT|nr:MAG: hypothetical protein A3I30_00010 [Candidatus Azambacteria bacterium RIFCSPLOWO2_02_FULL_44_14]OGY63597.1 MAG: hypothetical protein A3E64_00110 [Candidatus Harrisonbacteria bacterium RIFCSPHIGHO2_12_FULL_48_16]